MKLIKILPLLCFLVAVSSKTEAQDLHFSQFMMSPLSLNPANTGAFEGTFRIGGIYRDQWQSVITNSYKTPLIYVDAPVITGFRRQDWVGVGVEAYQDKAGAGQMTNSGFLFSGAYHIGLDKKSTNVLAIGIQGGYGQRRIGDRDKFDFEDNLKTGQPVASSQDYTKLATQDVKFLDVTAGVGLRSKLNATTKMNAGFAIHHINRPSNTYKSGGSTWKQPFLYVANLGLDVDLTKKWILSPSLLFQSVSGASEINIQALGSYLFNTEKKIRLNVGAGYRVADAAMMMVGMDYGDLRVGLAYDVNVSSLSQVSKYKGGFELGASYIVKIYKTPDVKPVIFCPRF